MWTGPPLPLNRPRTPILIGSVFFGPAVAVVDELAVPAEVAVAAVELGLAVVAGWVVGALELDLLSLPHAATSSTAHDTNAQRARITLFTGRSPSPVLPR
jgi:hypothetical protein